MNKDRIPRSLREALSLRRSSSGRPVMGALTWKGTGVGLLPLDQCEEFTRIDTDGRMVHMGAGCTAMQLQRERLAPPMLRYCASLCPEELQERGSLGGAVCSLRGEVLCVLEALEAQVTVASECGRRTMTRRSFCRRGLNLAEDELLCEILVPEDRGGSWRYEKLGTGAALAATLRWEKRRIAALTVAFALEDGQIVRFPEFERELRQKSAREARALRGELMAACRRWWPGKNETEREALLEKWEHFLMENKI